MYILHVYIYIYTYTYTYIYIYVHMHIQLHICSHFGSRRSEFNLFTARLEKRAGGAPEERRSDIV